MFLLLFEFFLVLKSVSIAFSVSLPIKISTGLLAEYIVRVSSKFLSEIKLFCITNWIFHSALSFSSLFDFIVGLWLFIKSLGYGLIISRYSSGDKFSYLYPLSYIRCNYFFFLQNHYRFLFVCNNLYQSL